MWVMTLLSAAYIVVGVVVVVATSSRQHEAEVSMAHR